MQQQHLNRPLRAIPPKTRPDVQSANLGTYIGVIT